MKLRDIPGYEGVYAASADGQIWAHPRMWVAGKGVARSHEGMWLNPTLDTTGYYRVRLTKSGQRRFPHVHQLVAEAWHPNPENKPQVNHKDGVKANCHKDNLEWATCRENIQHAFETGLSSMAHLRALTTEQVASARAALMAGCNKTHLARELGVDRKTLYGIEHGKTYRT